MMNNGDMVDIVHGGPTNPSIIPLEPHGLDQINSGTHAGCEPQNGANISGNLWLEKSNSHPCRVSQTPGILNDWFASSGLADAIHDWHSLLSSANAFLRH